MARQTFYYPPPGRPGWASPSKEQLELLYLAWGWRRYHETPQEPTRREGWLYFTVRSGTSSLVLPEWPARQIPLTNRDLIILHPDCLCGWSDAPGATAEICTWVWRSASRWESLRPPSGDFLRLKLNENSLHAVHALHQQTRGEIQNSDENTRLALEGLRLQVDLILARSLSSSAPPATDAQRLELACRWIEAHLTDHSPVTGLCDYLQLSASTLNRLFQRGMGQSVRTHAKQRRVARARHLIEVEKASVKETAYRLGYRFPNDLSRALSQG